MAITTNQITITTMEGWYSGATPPLNPLIGDLWLDTTSNEIKKYDGTNWIKQADTQGPQGPKGDSMVSRVAYWIKSSTKPEPPDPKTGDMKGWTEGSEPPESALAGILPSDKFWRIYKETYSNGESEYIKYSEVELIGSYEVLNGLVQFRKGVTTTENIDGQDVTVIDGGKIKTGSIDAKKIHVEDLEALKATIGGFHIGKNSIYSGNKNTIDSTERGIYFDSNGQSYFGDNKNFIRFYRSDKDNYKLQISADSLTFGSGVSVEKAFEDIKGDIQNAQDSADNVKDQIVSMGEQLVINGSGLMGDNTNFSALIFDASKANGSPGSFTREGTSYTAPISDTYIPINPNLRYSFEMDAISKNGLIRMYSFLDFYDVDKKSIVADSHMYIENTLTYLTQDLKNGDTVVHFNDLSGWNDTFTQDYRRGFIFWNYTNSFGYTYPELTYSRNSWGNLYENSNVDKTNNTITLNAPWSHGMFEAGTKLSQCSSGSTYKYQGMSYTKVPMEWTHYSGFYDGTDYSGKNVMTKFPPGTAYAKVGFLWNDESLDDQCWVTNISLKTDYDNAINNAQTTANKAQSTADTANNKIDNLEIGGRNLLKQYIWAGGRCEKIDDLTIKVGTEVGDTYFYLRSHCALTAGETYTISCEASNVPDGCNWSFGVRTQSSAWQLYINKNGKNFATGVLDADVDADTNFILDDMNGSPLTAPNIILTNFKLEKGNRATDWTPAPEDVDAGIDNAQTAADSAASAAANAQTTADTAKTNAATAQSTADTAKANAATAQTEANKAQTTADEALKGSKENAAQMAQMVTDFNGDIKNLQDQIDGNITTWFYDNDPAINLPPVTDWDTDKKKDAHLGDIYYNTVKGYAWRFMKSGSTYSWERITDTDVTKALADAAKAQDTADSKRRVFYSEPSVPYDAGDLWVQGSGGDILRCAQAKKSTGSYNRNDWVLASKYTDNSALNTWIEGEFATKIQELEEGLVDAKIETYYQTTDPSTGWSSTQKSEHKGDLWYNSTPSVQKYYRWSGTAWQELTATPPKEVFDSIDNKATIYTGTTPPSSPSQGDLWFKGANKPILTYVNNSWVEYNKYTDNTRAEEAYDKAGEAAKTADNYISTDSTGIMVSENKGATKETPSNATKNNVLITEKDVQIRNGQKVLALYGENTVIGDQNGSNISLSSDGVTVNDSGVKAATLKAIKNGWETVETRANFDGDSANAAMQSEAIWTCDYALEGEVSGVLNVYLNGPGVDSLPILSVSDAAYGFTRSDDIVTIRIDGSIALAQITDWAQYTSVTFTYVKWKDVTGVVASDEIHGVNGYIDNVYATNRILAGAQCNLVSVNDVKKILIVGNGDITKRANATAIMENGDIRILGDVYVGCREDSTGGVQLGKAMSVVRGDGTATANTGTVTSQPRWWRCGNIVQMEFTVEAKASVASGSNIAAGQIKGIPRPVTLNGIRSVSYYGDNANVIFVSRNGEFTVRNCGDDALAKGNNAIGSFTYITDGYML